MFLIVWPAWLLAGAPVKLVVWLFNRLATWTGAYYLWKRLRAQPLIWFWLFLFNALSLAGVIWLCRHLP